MTNFDISKYDVKRICSSSSLIAGDLAKRSPKESSAEHDPAKPMLLPASLTGVAPNELSVMVWSPNMNSHNIAVASPAQNNASTESSMSNPSSAGSAESPKREDLYQGTDQGAGRRVAGANAFYDALGVGRNEMQHGLEEYGQQESSKYDNGGEEHGAAGVGGGVGWMAMGRQADLQLPMFARWNQ